MKIKLNATNRLERELTVQGGVIDLLIPGGWVWKRLPDSIHNQRTGIGFDGILFASPVVLPVEVKIGLKKLTPKEDAFKDKLTDLGYSFMVLRWFNDACWTATIERADSPAIRSGMGSLVTTITYVITNLTTKGV